MRRGLLLLALIAGAALATPAAEAKTGLWPQPGRYSAALRWDDAHDTLRGSERISFANRAPRALRSVYLRVWPNAYGSCSRRWAHVSLTGGGRAAGWDVACTALRVRLRHP